MTIKQALYMLLEHNISAAPVLDMNQLLKCNWEDPCYFGDPYIGFVDTSDLAVLLLTSKRLGDELISVFRRMMGCGRAEEFVEFAVDLSENNPFIQIEDTATLLDAAAVLSCGVHRVAVLDKPSRRVNRIISQSALLTFIAHKESALGADADRTIRELKLGTSAVVCVSAGATMRQALEVLRNAAVPAVGVLDDDGHLLTCFSASDVRALACVSSFQSELDMHVSCYLRRVRQLVANVSVQAAGRHNTPQSGAGELLQPHTAIAASQNMDGNEFLEENGPKVTQRSLDQRISSFFLQNFRQHMCSQVPLLFAILSA